MQQAIPMPDLPTICASIQVLNVNVYKSWLICICEDVEIRRQNDTISGYIAVDFGTIFTLAMNGSASRSIDINCVFVWGLSQGFVGYRDFDSGNEKRFEHFQLAGEDAMVRFRAFLKTIKCDGGGDGPEDVAGGLQVDQPINIDA